MRAWQIANHNQREGGQLTAMQPPCHSPAHGNQLVNPQCLQSYAINS